MEEDKFARLKAVVRQAREAHETSPEDEDFKQRYENAKAALKRAMDEANAGTTRCILTLHSTNLFFLYQLLPQDLVRKTRHGCQAPHVVHRRGSTKYNFLLQLPFEICAQRRLTCNSSAQKPIRPTWRITSLRG